MVPLQLSLWLENVASFDVTHHSRLADAVGTMLMGPAQPDSVALTHSRVLSSSGPSTTPLASEAKNTEMQALSPGSGGCGGVHRQACNAVTAVCAYMAFNAVHMRRAESRFNIRIRMRIQSAVQC